MCKKKNFKSVKIHFTITLYLFEIMFYNLSIHISRQDNKIIKKNQKKNPAE